MSVVCHPPYSVYFVDVFEDLSQDMSRNGDTLHDAVLYTLALVDHLLQVVDTINAYLFTIHHALSSDLFTDRFLFLF